MVCLYFKYAKGYILSTLQSQSKTKSKWCICKEALDFDPRFKSAGFFFRLRILFDMNYYFGFDVLKYIIKL